MWITTWCRYSTNNTLSYHQSGVAMWKYVSGSWFYGVKTCCNTWKTHANWYSIYSIYSIFITVNSTSLVTLFLLHGGMTIRQITTSTCSWQIQFVCQIWPLGLTVHTVICKQSSWNVCQGNVHVICICCCGNTIGTCMHDVAFGAFFSCRNIHCTGRHQQDMQPCFMLLSQITAY